MSRLQTLYRHFIERVDGIFNADEVAEVEQEGIPSVCQGEDSFSYESIESVEDASRERKKSCKDGDSRPELHSSVQGEQSRDSAGDTLGEESLVTIKLEQQVMEPESTEEDTTYIRHDIPLRESQMGAHIESMRDMRLTLGSAIEVGQSYALTSSTVTVAADLYPMEMLEVDGVVM